ncbi:MAG: alpha/beta hydrolase [Polyangiaceae bacterium]|nr:alpha/beta hydrolase [Polyangiaceae bacterium]
MRRALFTLALLVAPVACGDDADASAGGGGQAPWTGGAGGLGGADALGGGGAGGAPTGGGGSGGGAPSELDQLLARLRADLEGTLLEESTARGWPVALAEGHVVVSTSGSLDHVAGDFNDWTPAPLTEDDGFYWAVVPAAPGERYKLANGVDTYLPDPWSRGYAYDPFGELSLVPGPDAHLERFFEVGAGESSLEPRTVRVFVPGEPATHVLYVHDGQNLFDPNAIWGGWHLDESAPPGVMLVGIDNTSARMDEYTHVADDIGQLIGGSGDEYAAFVQEVVRPLVEAELGEPAIVGTMGSSLGGLISLHIGLSYPDQYDFVGSLSGTLGWGSIGPHTGETLIERYDAAPVQPFVIYLDSGGDAGACADLDADGIEDDVDSGDNYCENIQMRDVLAANGYVFDDNLHHWHEPGAAHNEAAWAARVFRPLAIFAAL